MTYVCPVCGYPDVPGDPSKLGCFEICCSCGFQFGKTDRDEGYTYEQWRDRWIESGMQWNVKSIPSSVGWDPVQQLKNIGVHVET